MNSATAGQPTPVYLISPSGAVDPKAPLNAALRNLRAAGFAPVLDRAALRVRQRFAGADADRAAAFARAAGLGDTCAPALGGACLGLASPQPMGSAVAGPDGVAFLDVVVPAGAASGASR